MNFCTNCDNMYYMKIGDDDILKYYCRNCGNEKDQPDLKNLRVSLYEKVSTTQRNINAYLKYDPTLPHSHTIKCPNSECESNKSSEGKPLKVSDVIYYRYDDIQMKYMYICALCDYNWKL